ncbi:hypothetical protein DESA109040_01160 [Deinococcus saxicola]|uniref:hypothetical protein n=1 Tax=Deinococcus saxicola TaxID=249406 RepID=UPI0039EEBCE4
MRRIRNAALALAFAFSASGALADVIVEDLGTYNSFGCGVMLELSKSISDHSFYCVRNSSGKYTLYEVYLIEVVEVRAN